MISRSLDHSGELFRRALRVYRAAGRPVPPDSETRLSLTLSNGSRVISRPGSNESTRGFTSDLLIIDEASRVPDTLYTASLPVLAKSGGRLLALSTPAGKRGFFYDAWANGSSDFQRFYCPASSLPESWYKPSTSVFLARERRRMPEREYRQEYLCDFNEPEGSVFDRETIAAAFDTDVEPLWPHLQEGMEDDQLGTGYASDFGFDDSDAQPLFPDYEQEKKDRYFYAIAEEDGEERYLVAEGYDIEKVEEAAEEHRRIFRKEVVRVKEREGGNPSNGN